MDQHVKPTPGEIRRARADNAQMRERDLAGQLGISEAELVAAHVGEGVRRIEPRVRDVLLGLDGVGEVMALTRNDSAVHEKVGVYRNVSYGEHAALVLGGQIDLRIFPKVWEHGFAVEKRDGNAVRHSLQFFCASGEAVHKVHLCPASDLGAYSRLVDSLLSADQSPAFDRADPAPKVLRDETGAGVEELRDRWSRMTDVHQFFGMLKELKLSRRQAVRMVGQDFAWQLSREAVAAAVNGAAAGAVPIMCFVGNRGCIQIHSGPVQDIRPMGPWLNVMDAGFHLHLRLDHVDQAWVVRKPTSDGHVTSLEVYDAAGDMFIQFFGERHEGEAERDDWRSLAEGLPRIPAMPA